MPVLMVLRALLQDHMHTRLRHMLREGEGGGDTKNRDIDFEGFRWFLDTFLELPAPDELSRHLFLSFVRRDRRPALREMAAASSAAACAPVTAHGDHQRNVCDVLGTVLVVRPVRQPAASSACALVGGHRSWGPPGQKKAAKCESDSPMKGSKHSLASKIQGLAERLQQLGKGSGDSVDGDKGSRSRTGPMNGEVDESSIKWRPRTGKRSVGRPGARWTENLKRVAGGGWMRGAEDSVVVRHGRSLCPAGDCCRLMVMMMMTSTKFIEGRSYVCPLLDICLSHGTPLSTILGHSHPALASSPAKIIAPPRPYVMQLLCL
ncbi:hypothetical protein MSG28_014994 [Choristoneura fumiferana]|uniref:Uncharacterized protein n=1 Tax=Choristoneura fumiferana TaxID=7141 RepID=A0ACC0KXV1_CHOFU|nr:hypothetical protein MSG28_014994 [Choristoneura fumiferana]